MYSESGLAAIHTLIIIHVNAIILLIFRIIFPSDHSDITFTHQFHRKQHIHHQFRQKNPAM